MKNHKEFGRLQTELFIIHTSHITISAVDCMEGMARMVPHPAVMLIRLVTVFGYISTNC
jgi:hypothetical protein